MWKVEYYSYKSYAWYVHSVWERHTAATKRCTAERKKKPHFAWRVEKDQKYDENIAGSEGLL